MIYCSVNGCFSNNQYGDKERTLFRCPLENLERALKWQQFCCDPTIRSAKVLYVCDLHFLKSDFYLGEDNKSFLKSHAVPCLNGPKNYGDKSDFAMADSVSWLIEQPHGKDFGESSSSNVQLLNEPTASTTFNVSQNTPKVYSSDTKSLKVNVDQNSPKLSSLGILKPIDPGKLKALPKNAKLVPINLIQNADGSKIFVPVDLKLNTKKGISTHNHTIPIETQQFESAVRLEESSNSSHSLKRPGEDITCASSKKVLKISNESFEITLHHDFNSKELEEGNILPSNSESEVFTGTRKAKIYSNNGVDFDIDIKSTITFEDDSEKLKLPEFQAVPDFQTSVDDFDSSETYDLSFLNKKSRVDVGLKRRKESQLKSTRMIFSDPPETPFVERTEHRQVQPLTNIRFNKKKGDFKRYSKKNKMRINLNDPKYSIAAAADSFGTFNSFIEEPLKKVDIKNNEWDKLFISSGIKYPKLTKSHIGSMVNQLREKLPRLNDKDTLDVLFVLNMMSIYPSAPEKVKEEMFQRLCMVFIATTFKWETALALARRKVENSGVDPVSPSEPNNESTTGEVSTENQTNQSNLKKLPKHPKFPFEIIVHEKPKEKKNWKKKTR